MWGIEQHRSCSGNTQIPSGIWLNVPKLNSVLYSMPLAFPVCFPPKLYLTLHPQDTAAVLLMASFNSSILLFEVQELFSEDLAIPCALGMGTGVSLETCSA